jgi:hypothetical protein
VQPFFLAPAMPNCHSLAVPPNYKRLVVSVTNGSSNGNGRVLDKNKEYPGNWSPLHVWDLPAGRARPARCSCCSPGGANKWGPDADTETDAEMTSRPPARSRRWRLVQRSNR